MNLTKSITAVLVQGASVAFVRMESVTVKPGFGGSIICSLLDAQGKVVARRVARITPEEYAAWGADDSYLWGIVSSKLNVTITGDALLVPQR